MFKSMPQHVQISEANTKTREEHAAACPIHAAACHEDAEKGKLAHAAACPIHAAA